MPYLYRGEAIVYKSGFQTFKIVHICTYTHEITDPRGTKVAVHHSNVYNLSSYCFSLLVLPISLFEESSTMLIIDSLNVCDEVIFTCEGPVIPVPACLML